MKVNYKLRRKLNSVSEWIQNCWNTKMEVIIYVFAAIVGLLCIIIAASLEGNCSDIFLGLGTGAVSSLIVSLVINNATNKRIIKEKIAAKDFIFSKMLICATNVYTILIYKINEFALFSEKYEGQIYELYNNFEKYNDFENVLKKVKYDESEPKLKEQLNVLFDFPKHDILMLASEIKNFPKQELYIQGIINDEEYKDLIGEYSKDEYWNIVKNLNNFRAEEIKDYEMCIRFMRANIWICSKIIKAIGNVKKVCSKEENIKDTLSEKYFNEVEVFTEKYIEWEIQQAEMMNEYYNEHPELLEEAQAAWDAEENQTPTERNISALSYYIFGMCWGSGPIEEILENLNPEDEVVKNYFSSDEVKKELKKNRRIRKSVNNIYGKNYLKNLWKKAN